jgi:hypothetical protein
MSWYMTLTIHYRKKIDYGLSEIIDEGKTNLHFQARCPNYPKESWYLILKCLHDSVSDGIFYPSVKTHQFRRVYCPSRGWVRPHTRVRSLSVLWGCHRRAVKVLNGCRNVAGNRFSAVGKPPPPPAVVQAYHLKFKNKHCFSGWLRADRDNIWESEVGSAV